jgi:tRNA A37 threonylcarbamoyladenosine modification protein TsaB
MLTLGISTSAGQFAVLLGADGVVLYDSGTPPSGSRSELPDMLSVGLSSLQASIKDISHIIVDTGPGGTSRVRTGISFANGLSYSLGIPVSPVSSLELAGLSAWEVYQIPIVCAIKSIRNNVYAGIFDGSVVRMEYGLLPDVLPVLLGDVRKFAVVGTYRTAICSLPALADCEIIDSGLPYGDARLFIEKSYLFIPRGLRFPEIVEPVTERTL